MHEQPKEIFDKASAIVIEAFNAQGIPYGNSSKHSYPVRREDIFAAPVRGGSSRPVDECRVIIAYILANHIPVYDPMRCAERLSSNMVISNYLLRADKGSTTKMVGSACRLLKTEEYSGAYNRALIALRQAGFQLWKVDKPTRVGSCT